MDQEGQHGQKNKEGEIVDEEFFEVEPKLVAMVTVGGLDHYAGEQHQDLKQSQHSEQRHDFRDIADPCRMRGNVFNLVHARIPFAPHEYAGVVSDHRDHKQIERALDQFDNPVSDRIRSVAVAFFGREDDAGDCVGEGRHHQHDE